MAESVNAAECGSSAGKLASSISFDRSRIMRVSKPIADGGKGFGPMYRQTVSLRPKRQL